MEIYIKFYIIFFIVFLSAIFEFFFASRREQLLISFFISLFLILIIGLRGNFDSDYPTYTQIFNDVSYDNWDAFISSFDLNVEIFFVFLIMLLKVFFLGPQSIFFLSALISISINWIYCIRLLPYPTLIFLGLLSHSFLYKEFTQIRHGIAGALCVASIFLLSQRKLRQAYILQFFAIFFHSAAIFVSFFSIIYTLLPRKKFILLGSIVGMLLFLLGAHKAILIISEYIYLPPSATIYFNSEYDYNLGILNPTLLKQVALIIFFFLCGKWLDIKDKLYLDLMSFYYISIIWLFSLNEFAIFAARLASFFGVLEVYLFSLLLYHVNNRVIKLILFGSILIFYCAQFYLNINYKDIFSADYFLNL